MGRQRTINDAEFWRAPRIADRTQEDKATLLYLLTSPYSNIIGVYPIVPRIAAAEMGWTADQLLTIVKRLKNFKLVDYDSSANFIWVRNWWDHNSARMAVATTLREKTYAQIAAIPADWRADFLSDFLGRIPVTDKNDTALRSVVAGDLATRGYSVAIPYGQATDSPAANTTNNANSNFNHYGVDNAQLEYPILEKRTQEQLEKIIERLPIEMRQDVLDEIAAKMHSGNLRSPIRLAQHFASKPSTFVISEGIAVREARVQRLAIQSELHSQAKKRADELSQIDAQLGSMSKEQFENVYGRFPESLQKEVRNRWLRLSGGNSI